MNRYFLKAFTVMALLCSFTSLAHAQATRTWVSGVGDDVNPCSRTAPCKTFAGTLSKTAAGGEISVLDPGGFGAVTITKAVTINGDGTLAAITSSLSNGVVVNAGVNDVVILRNISINGGGNGTNGIRYLAGKQLVVDGVDIRGITQSGIDVSVSTNANLLVRNSSIRGGTTGIRMAGTAGNLHASINQVTLFGATNALHTSYGTADVSNSNISQNSGYGVLAENVGTINLESTMVTGNGVGIQSQTGATIRMSNTDIFSNATGVGCGGGTLASANNNRKAGNIGGGLPTCNPNATITVQ